MKAVDSLTRDDLASEPVWQFVEDTEGDEMGVRPVRPLPVPDLMGKLVGTQVRLADGRSVWALIGNVNVTNPRFTEHLLTLSIEHGGRWFHLARYHDFDYSERGPDKLAEFLGLTVDEVFPVTYDLRPYVSGTSAVLHGMVQKEPTEELTRAEIIRLAAS